MATRDEQTVSVPKATETTGNRLERVLVRAGNARLSMALADLARDLAPTASHRQDLPTIVLFHRAA